MARPRKSSSNTAQERMAGTVDSGIVAKTQKFDPKKAKLADKVERERNAAAIASMSGMNREAGMMIDPAQQFNNRGTPTSFTYDAYRNSYSNGLGYRIGTDIPMYFITMNQKNGGMIYFPTTLQEKYSHYRYFARCIFLNDNLLGQVLMADFTTKSIKDIVVGDLVITGIGTTRAVKNKFERRCIEDRAVTIKANCLQNPLKTTHHHPYWILRSDKVQSKSGHNLKNPVFSPEWVHAENIRRGDYVLVPRTKRDVVSSLTPDEARFLGYYASEGCILWDYRNASTLKDSENSPAHGWKHGDERVKVAIGCSFSFSLNEKDTLVKKTIDLAKKLFGVDAFLVTNDNDQSIQVRLSSREAAGFCLDNVGEKSQYKKLSENVLRASDESVKEFILGYAEGDGHQAVSGTDHGKITIVTSSKCLASQVEMLAISIGLPCRVANYSRKEGACYPNGKPFNQIHFPPWSANLLIENSVKWNKSETDGIQRGCVVVGDYLAYRVSSVVFTEEDDLVYNIEVDADGDEKSYICNGMVTHNTDAYVGRALDLMTDLPMSKMTLNMPKCVPAEKKEEIRNFFKHQMELLGGFQTCKDMLRETNLIGNAYIFCEWSDEKSMWVSATILPPEEVFIFTIPFTNVKRIEYRPPYLINLIRGNTGATGLPESIALEIEEAIPDDVRTSIMERNSIVFDSDPSSGSFCHHITRNKTPYFDLGESILERVMVPLQLKEFYKYAQLSVASRNMTPTNLVIADKAQPAAMDNLREQIDMRMLDPDYTICVNFDVRWEQIGAQNRLLDLDREYERIENQIFAAFGVTRELLTGEGAYSGAKFTLDIINTMFLMSRDIVQDFWEGKLFRKVCEARNWYSEDGNGVKTYWHPKIGFNRLSIKDNAETFSSLMELYNKGSLPVDIIYELFNLSSDEIEDKLKQDLFTPRDPTFNRLAEAVMTDAGRALTERSDLLERIAKSLGLKLQPAQDPNAAMQGGGDAFGGGGESAPGGEGELTGGGEELPAGGVQDESTEEPTDATEEDSGFKSESGFDTELDKKAKDIASKLNPDSKPEEIIREIAEYDKKSQNG